MQTKRFEPGAIALDVCAAHGIWFDRHELAQVVQAESERREADAADTASAASSPTGRRSVDRYAAAERGRGSLWGQPLEGQLESGLLYALGHLIRALASV